MRIDRRLTFIGVMLIVLSMTMATQYATTKVSFTFGIVHPSNADIRFIGSDNSSDGLLVLRVYGNTSGNRALAISFGNISENYNKTFTAAFGIVNEEPFLVNITHINVSTNGAAADCLKIWLHGNRDALAPTEAGECFVWDKGTKGFTTTSTAWVLGAGNKNAADMSMDGLTQLSTPWNATSHVRYSLNNANNSVNGTSDYVWVQVSIDVADGVASGTVSGTIYVHFKARNG
jgi:hypothetical protein